MKFNEIHSVVSYLLAVPSTQFRALELNNCDHPITQ